jgi:hypothetical protein
VVEPVAGLDALEGVASADADAAELVDAACASLVELAGAVVAEAVGEACVDGAVVVGFDDREVGELGCVAEAGGDDVELAEGVGAVVGGCLGGPCLFAVGAELFLGLEELRGVGRRVTRGGRSRRLSDGVAAASHLVELVAEDDPGGPR